MPAGDVHFLIPRTCDYVTLHGKKDFAEVKAIETELSLNYPGVPSVITRIFKNEESPSVLT